MDNINLSIKKTYLTSLIRFIALCLSVLLRCNEAIADLQQAILNLYIVLSVLVYALYSLTNSHRLIMRCRPFAEQSRLVSSFLRFSFSRELLARLFCVQPVRSLVSSISLSHTCLLFNNELVFACHLYPDRCESNC